LRVVTPSRLLSRDLTTVLSKITSIASVKRE
jgi:hypothetical protein